MINTLLTDKIINKLFEEEGIFICSLCKNAKKEIECLGKTEKICLQCVIDHLNHFNKMDKKITPQDDP